MPYTVTRNGQTYGPYTLEDLQRYVASGNILPSDMAKSDEMPEWVPVAQLIGTPVSIPPTTPTYAQPTGAAYPDPPNLNWGLELLLGFFTFGLFVIAWNLVIASWAKRVRPASNALMYYIIATVLILINFGGSYGVVIAIGHHHHPHQSVFSSLIGIASWVVRLIARFTLRDDIEQHFNGPEPLGIRLSAVLTFFFGGIYFQYKLNQINDLKQTLRYRNATR
jgi:GYF domain 2